MDNKVIILLISTLATFSVVAVKNSDNASEDNKLGGNIPQSIHLIGNVDGKSVFVDNLSNMTWVQSEAYCQGMGMRLASITSENQARILRNSFNAFFNGSFWTSGHDAQDYRQFSWDDSNLEPNSSYLAIGNHTSVAHLTCLAYHHVHTEENNGTILLSHLDPQPCSLTLGAMCEAV